MNDPLKPDSSGEIDSARLESDQAAQEQGVKNTALVVSSAAKNAVVRLADSYARWHDLKAGQKDENYFSWLGWQVLIWGLGGALLWATFAPIEKGVSTSGWVMTDSNRKAIQPSFAGIVDDIYVKEGQIVKAGEVLVKLNPVNAQSQVNGTNESISGLEEQIKATERSIIQKKLQIELLNKEIVGLRKLYEEGFVSQSKVFEMERQTLQLKAVVLEDEGNVTRTKKQISELQEKLNPYQFDLDNTQLKSPVEGQVVNITIFTKGGVVSPGQKLMEVVPTNEEMIIEGQLPVHLVDKVRVDLPVEIMFTAFNVNRTPHIPGVLISVGGDRIVDEKTGNPYYKIQAVPTAKGSKMLGDLKVRPGMPVELFIRTGEQSMMTYLLKPVFDRAHSAMRED